MIALAAEQAERLVLIGHVAGAFGVRGEVRIHPYTDAAKSVSAYGPLLDGDGRLLLTPTGVHAIKDGVAVTAPEVKTREDAEALKGAKLYVPRSKLPPPEEDEFYAVDLLGCRVERSDGQPLGHVKALHDFGAGDVLEIQDDRQTWYLAFTARNVPRIELEARKVIVDPPPDLADAEPNA